MLHKNVAWESILPHYILFYITPYSSLYSLLPLYILYTASIYHITVLLSFIFVYMFHFSSEKEYPINNV